jgi:hypothetical protein
VLGEPGVPVISCAQTSGESAVLTSSPQYHYALEAKLLDHQIRLLLLVPFRMRVRKAAMQKAMHASSPA